MKKMSSLFFCVSMFHLLFAQSIQSVKQNISSHAADSFYLMQDWSNAKAAYEAVLKTDTLSNLQWTRLGFACYSLREYGEALKSYNKAAQNKPSAQLQPLLYSRMARVYAMQNNVEEVLRNLDSAIHNGYTNFNEMDSLKDYAALQTNEKFKALRNKAYAIAYPCTADAKAREFDFWVGEWNVYQTGTNFLVGHSVIQLASGGCMILENWTAVGSPHNGKSMNFVDSKTGKWEQVWAGSNGGGANFFVNGEYRDSAMRFDFEQTDAQGNKLKGRFSFFNQGKNQVRQLNETSADDGKTWNTGYDFTYIRKDKK